MENADGRHMGKICLEATTGDVIAQGIGTRTTLEAFGSKVVGRDGMGTFLCIIAT